MFKQGPNFQFEIKQFFEISEVEITGVNCNYRHGKTVRIDSHCLIRDVFARICKGRIPPLGCMDLLAALGLHIRKMHQCPLFCRTVNISWRNKNNVNIFISPVKCSFSHVR